MAGKRKSPSTIFLAVADLADLFGVSQRTIRDWADNGTLPAPLRLSPRCLRWRKETIDQHLAALEPQAGKVG